MLHSTEQSAGKAAAPELSHVVLSRRLHLHEAKRIHSTVVGLRSCDAGQVQHQRHVVLVISKLQMMPHAVGLTGVTVTGQPALQHPLARYTTFS